ncbi:MAG: hypothetical protein R3E10_13380 [Gemmatimonadota bacterium]
MTTDRADRSWTGLALLAAALVVAAWRWFAAGAPPGGDWAQYMGHALALLQGRPYEDTGYLYSPLAWTVGPPRYPPGLPLTLTPLFMLFGTSTLAPRLLMHAFLFAFLALVARYFLRDGEPPALVWGSVAMLGASFLLRDVPNVVGSDLGFCALAWTVLLLADRPGAWSGTRTIAIAALGAWAILYRIAAAPLIPALLVPALIRRREVGVRALLPALVWTVVLVVVVTRFGPGQAPVDTMSGVASGGGERSVGASLQWLLERMDRKVLRYRFALQEAWLYPFPGRSADRIYHVLALGLTAIGGLHWIRRRWPTFAASFVLFTAAMLTVAPVWDPRYLWVLTPFACYGLFSGAASVLARLGSHDRARVHRGVAAVGALMVLGAGIETARTGAPAIPRDDLAWATVQTRLQRLGDGRPLRVVSNRPRIVAWRTGVPAMPLPNRPLDTFLTEARRLGITHAVITEAAAEPELLERWQQWLRERPELFTLVETVGPVRLYRVHLAPSTS